MDTVGDVLLVVGVGGGVSSAGLVLGKAMGATVYVTGRSSEEGKSHPLGGTIQETAAAVTESGGKGVAGLLSQSERNGMMKRMHLGVIAVVLGVAPDVAREPRSRVRTIERSDE